MPRELVVDTTKFRAALKVTRNRCDELLYRRGLRQATLYICEAPKSGGTWVRGMVSDMLDRLPASEEHGSKGIKQNHWPHDARYRPAVYVLRDGRDCLVSLYFHNARLVRERSIWAPRLDRFFTEALGPRYNLDNIQDNLPLYIEALNVDPLGGMLRPSRRRAFVAWPDHVTGWLAASGIVVLRYEALLTGAAHELVRVGEYLGLDVPLELADTISLEHAFSARTGRDPGSEDRSSFYRKGVAGDWKTWFTREAAIAFDRFAGDALVSSGYEHDRSWIDEVGDATGAHFPAERPGDVGRD